LFVPTDDARIGITEAILLECADRRNRMTRDLRAWPIIAGLLVDLAGSVAWGIGYGIVKVARQGAAAREGAHGITVGTTTDLIFAAVVGLWLVVMGGYVAARMARVRPVAHGTCVGLGTLVVTLVGLWLLPDSSTPLWFTAVSTLGVVPAGSLGGHFGRRSAPASQPPDP
jgi:hypothetical protein